MAQERRRPEIRRRRKRNRQTRRARNQAADEAKKKYEPLRAKQEKVRADLRREFNKQFTPDQLRLWAGDMLYTAVLPKFSGQLSDEQKAQALAICCVLADVSEFAIKHDPYLEPTANLKERAMREIERLFLRADQQGKTRTSGNAA